LTEAQSPPSPANRHSQQEAWLRDGRSNMRIRGWETHQCYIHERQTLNRGREKAAKRRESHKPHTRTMRTGPSRGRGHSIRVTPSSFNRLLEALEVTTTTGGGGSRTQLSTLAGIARADAVASGAAASVFARRELDAVREADIVVGIARIVACLYLHSHGMPVQRRSTNTVPVIGIIHADGTSPHVMRCLHT